MLIKNLNKAKQFHFSFFFLLYIKCDIESEINILNLFFLVKY